MVLTLSSNAVPSRETPAYRPFDLESANPRQRSLCGLRGQLTGEEWCRAFRQYCIDATSCSDWPKGLERQKGLAETENVTHPAAAPSEPPIASKHLSVQTGYN